MSSREQVDMCSREQPIQLGLCCLNMTLRAQNPSVYCSRKMIIRTIKEKGIVVLKQKIIENLHDLYKLDSAKVEN